MSSRVLVRWCKWYCPISVYLSNKHGPSKTARISLLLRIWSFFFRFISGTVFPDPGSQSRNTGAEILLGGDEPKVGRKIVQVESPQYRSGNFKQRFIRGFRGDSRGRFETSLATAYHTPTHRTPDSPINSTGIASMIRLLRGRLTQRRYTNCWLERLPNKILLQIAAQLAPNLRDLIALLRTDRSPHHLLTPELHTWSLCAGPDSYGCTNIRNVAARGPCSLLAKLLSLAQGCRRTSRRHHGPGRSNHAGTGRCCRGTAAARGWG